MAAKRAAPAPPGKPFERDWTLARLFQLVEIDQWARAQPPEIIARGRYTNRERDYFLKRVATIMDALGEAQGRDVEPLLEAHAGWFKLSVFGPDGDKAGWLLVQHADRLPALQKRTLAVLEKLYPVGEAQASSYAYLWDRVAVNERRGQRYGTQGRLVGGEWKPYRVEEPEDEVDARRRTVGLEPLAAYARRFVKIPR